MKDITEANAALLGDRHLRADPNNSFSATLPATDSIVRITTTAKIASSLAGQQTLWMLVNLLARQFSVTREIEICVPPTLLLPHVALFGEAEYLHDSLLITAKLIAGKEINICPVQDRARIPSAEILVGKVLEISGAPFHITVLADGWSIFAGSQEDVPAVVPEKENPLGPYFAACLAAGEVFKFLRRLREGVGSYILKFYFSLWDFKDYDSWQSLPAGEWPPSLPPLYLVGTGAVGQAAAACFAASAAEGYITTIDGGKIDDPTNLNRYALTHQGNLGESKSLLTTAILKKSGISSYPYEGHWADYVADSARPVQLKGVHENESAYRYALVLSCVDKNPGRHDIQNYWPEYLMGGSTNGLALEVNAYDMRSPYECLKCFNHLPATQTIEEIAKELRSLPAADQRLRAEECRADWELLKNFLDDPDCGKAGAAEIAKFRAEAIDWSVGFVSVAAGIILAAQTFKFALKGRGAFPEEVGNSLRFNFINPRAHITRHRRRANCDCNTGGRTAFEQLWGRLHYTSLLDPTATGSFLKFISPRL